MEGKIIVSKKGEFLTKEDFLEVMKKKGEIGLLYASNEYFDLLIHISEETCKLTCIPVPVLLAEYARDRDSSFYTDLDHRLGLLKEHGIKVQFVVPRKKGLACIKSDDEKKQKKIFAKKYRCLNNK